MTNTAINMGVQISLQDMGFTDRSIFNKDSVIKNVRRYRHDFMEGNWQYVRKSLMVSLRIVKIYPMKIIRYLIKHLLSLTQDIHHIIYNS